MSKMATLQNSGYGCGTKLNACPSRLRRDRSGSKKQIGRPEILESGGGTSSCETQLAQAILAEANTMSRASGPMSCLLWHQAIFCAGSDLDMQEDVSSVTCGASSGRSKAKRR